MASRHLVRRAADAEYGEPANGLSAGSVGLAQWSAIDEEGPAVHTGFGLCSLAPHGLVTPRVNSYEESVFVIEGSVVLETDSGPVSLQPGDYALVPIGVSHAWRNASEMTARWAYMVAPQPRYQYGGDSHPSGLSVSSAPEIIDVRDPRSRYVGHIDPQHMDAAKQTQDLLAVSASMRTALLVYSGITVKMMVDSDLGAYLTMMFMVQYEPDGVAGAHDHPFEETYLILDGHVEAEFDGTRYELAAGDVAFAGVGCVHAFRNIGSGTVRWLETQAPQPPSRHAYRFQRDWEYLRSGGER